MYEKVLIRKAELQEVLIENLMVFIPANCFLTSYSMQSVHVHSSTINLDVTLRFIICLRPTLVIPHKKTSKYLHEHMYMYCTCALDIYWPSSCSCTVHVINIMKKQNYKTLRHVAVANCLPTQNVAEANLLCCYLAYILQRSSHFILSNSKLYCKRITSQFREQTQPTTEHDLFYFLNFVLTYRWIKSKLKPTVIRPNGLNIGTPERVPMVSWYVIKGGCSTACPTRR